MVLYGAWNLTFWGTVISILGRLFGYNNFGKLFGLMSFVNGATGLLNIPLNNWVVDDLDSRYWIVTVGQMVVVAPLFVYCFILWKRARENVEENVIRAAHGQDQLDQQP